MCIRDRPLYEFTLSKPLNEYDPAGAPGVNPDGVTPLSAACADTDAVRATESIIATRIFRDLTDPAKSEKQAVDKLNMAHLSFSLPLENENNERIRRFSIRLSQDLDYVSVFEYRRSCIVPARGSSEC